MNILRPAHSSTRNTIHQATRTMKLNHIVIASIVLLGASASAVTLSRLYVRQAEAPTAEEAVGLLALIEAEASAFAAQQGAPARPAAVRSQAPSATTILTELDHMHALRASVAETSSQYIVTVANDSVPDEHASNLRHVAHVAHAELRYETLAATHVFPLTQSGTTWVASIPKDLGFLPAHSIALGVWEAGTSLQYEHDAVYWWKLRFQ